MRGNTKKQQYTSAFDRKEIVHQLVLVCRLLCFLLSLSVSLLTPEEDNFCRKRLCTVVSLCFVALVSTFPYICSVQSGIYAPGKAHMRSATSLSSFPNVAFETIATFVSLHDDGPSHPFKGDRLALPLSTPIYSRRSMT